MNGRPGPRSLADARTLEALDFAAVRQRVVGATRTQRGRARAAEMTPQLDFDRIRAEQVRTAAARDAIVRTDLHVLPAMDTAELTQAASVGRTLGASDLRGIGDALSAAAAAYNAVREIEAMREVTAGYAPRKELQRALTDSIDERGVVLDRASPALGRIRRNLAQAQADARDRVAATLRSAKYAKAIQDSVVTIREGRFVVPVKAEFSGMVPGIVHDTSSSGQTLFVEPLAALEANNRLRTLRIEEEREVQRILEDLSHRAGAEAGAIEANVEMLAAIDVLVAKGQVARSMDATQPDMTDEPAIAIDRGRHPLLGERAVPQSLTLDANTRLLVISGPNMGGKTVALKMVGLFVAMAYCGMQLPAAHVSIGSFDCVIADIGDEQSIAGNASTFSAHLTRMREMLERAGHRTLAIVDEIGGGTEPTAGAALAIAMLDRLLETGAHAVVTTHATELKLFAHSASGVANASVRFDPLTFKPTFHLDVGAPGQSLAFPLARALGIDEAIVEQAQHSLDNRERDYESALAELAMRTAELQHERDRLAGERAATLRELQALERDRVTLDAQRGEFAGKAEERVQQALREFVRELQRRAAERTSSKPKVTQSDAALLERTLDSMHRDLGIVPKAQEPKTPAADAPFERDDPVRILTLSQDGTVVEDYGDTVLVAIGPMKTVVKRKDLSRRARGPAPRGAVASAQGAASSSKGGAARMSAAARTTGELDVRGRRFVEAEPLVERWLDEAMLAGNTPLRLIHGKGTGMLGRGLQEYLRANPAVKSVRYGNEDEGSSGVTIVELQQ